MYVRKLDNHLSRKQRENTHTESARTYNDDSHNQSKPLLLTAREEAYYRTIRFLCCIILLLFLLLLLPLLYFEAHIYIYKYILRRTGINVFNKTSKKKSSIAALTCAAERHMTHGSIVTYRVPPPSLQLWRVFAAA